MKSLVIFFSMLISVSAFSKSEPVLVACSDDQVNYNVLFLLEDRQVVSYSINEGNWGEAVVLTSEEQKQNELFIQYEAGSDDTNYGYVLYNTKNMFENWKVKSWTSGNDSDNYYPVVNDNPVYCHILLRKTQSTKVSVLNIYKKL